MVSMNIRNGTFGREENMKEAVKDMIEKNNRIICLMKLVDPEVELVDAVGGSSTTSGDIRGC
eukprot:scaffold3753_cov411-Chaetoceros_neogracile.AAC.5